MISSNLELGKRWGFRSKTQFMSKKDNFYIKDLFGLCEKIR